MRSVYYPDKLELGATIALDETEATHLVKVLRLNKDDFVEVVNGCGLRARALVIEVNKGRRGCRCRLRLESIESPMPARPRIHLFVAPPRPKHMESIIEATTALGVFSITPILCHRSVRFPDKRDRWEAGAITAMKQSGNPYAPKIQDALDFEQALTISSGIGFFGDFLAADSSVPLADGDRSMENIELWIGPEGGFDDTERDALINADLRPLCIGIWTLRVEVAAVALTSLILGGRVTRH